MIGKCDFSCFKYLINLSSIEWESFPISANVNKSEINLVRDMTSIMSYEFLFNKVLLSNFKVIGSYSTRHKTEIKSNKAKIRVNAYIVHVPIKRNHFVGQLNFPKITYCDRHFHE